MSKEDKQKVIKLAVKASEEKLKTIQQGIENAREAAIKAPGFMQSASDTTKSEMGRLIDSLSIEEAKYQELIKELKLLFSDSSKQIEPENGALVHLKAKNHEKLILIVKHGSGIKFNFKDNEVIVISPQAPMIKNLKARDNIKISNELYQINSIN